MKYRAALLLITATSLAFVFTACKTQPPKVKPVEKVQMVQDNIDLNIHIRHFQTKQCLQGVSEWVYSELPADSINHFKKDPAFIRHHNYSSVLNGTCDNTVELLDAKTGKSIYRCGGHTLNRR